MSDIEKSLCLKIIRHLRNDGDILSLYSQGFFKRNSFFVSLLGQVSGVVKLATES